MRYRPTHCPYCGDEVEKMRPYQTHQPPDEREDYPKPPVADSQPAGPPNTPTVPVIDCQLLTPCGHLFRDSDFEAVFEGDDPVSTLGERVVNPNSPVDPQ